MSKQKLNKIEKALQDLATALEENTTVSNVRISFTIKPTKSSKTQKDNK